MTKIQRMTTDPVPSVADARPLYFLPRDNLAREVLIPAFSTATSVQCMFGFFSSAILAELAPGLASYINRKDSKLLLIISPFINAQDQAALREGLKKPEEVAVDLFEDGLIAPNDLERHTLKCLSYLLASDRIQIKIALMKDALFHPKIWLFSFGGLLLAVHGSSNMTVSGITKNKEQISVSKGWMDPTQKYTSEKMREEFDLLWENKDDDCLIFNLPSAVRDKILREYASQSPPTEKDYIELYERVVANSDSTSSVPASKSRAKFEVPAWLKYTEGDYAHQGSAVNAWVDNGYKGTLEMATGSGKTLTAMIAANKLFNEINKLLIIIAAPYIPLIQQWCDEVALFGIRPINLTLAKGEIERNRRLYQIKLAMSHDETDIEVIVVTHDTLSTPAFCGSLKKIDCPKLIIADEAHNLGRPGFLNNLPDFVEYRLALSATPVRQYDPEGSEAIFSFFGQVVFQFTLKDAIGKCLVPYDYYVHRVTLTPEEMDDWRDITQKIKQNFFRQQDGKPDEFLSKLYRVAELF
jgi:hypothetical protein